MALIDRTKRTPKAATPTGSGRPFATIDADSFDKAGKDQDRQRLMRAADRYNAASKPSDPR